MLVKLLLSLFMIFSVLLVTVVILQAKMKKSLKVKQSPEKEKALNIIITGVGIIFLVVVFLLSVTYNKINQSIQNVENTQETGTTQTEKTTETTNENVTTPPQATPETTTQPVTTP